MARTLELSASQLVCSVLALLVSTFIIKLVRHRSAWRALNLPGPPHSFLWGSLQVLGEHRGRMPRDASIDYTALSLAKEYGTLSYFDLWPFSLSMCIVADPTLADKICRQDNLPKCLQVMYFDFAVLGSESILLADVRNRLAASLVPCGIVIVNMFSISTERRSGSSALEVRSYGLQFWLPQGRSAPYHASIFV